MFKKRQLSRTMAIAGAACFLLTGSLFAAEKQQPPTSLDGDVVEYNMKTGVVTAKGNVLMTQGDMKSTGDEAEYNSKTKAGRVEGNVIAIDKAKDLRITCHKATTDAEQHMVAEGDVHGKMEDKTFAGDRVDYFQQKDYALIENGGTITSKEGVFTADRMEGFLKEEHIIGRGNAHMISPANDMEAGGDQLDYYGLEQDQAILTGNAWAIQYNNTLKSNRLVIHLNDQNKATVSE